MHLNNRTVSILAIAGIILLLLIRATGLIFNINDIFYLNKIIGGVSVSAGEHNFFVQKNSVAYLVETICFFVYIVFFLIWFYRAYHNVFIKEPNQAPFKRALIPFSVIIPIFNLYAPYQIMKFIWWGNSHSVDYLNKGYATIKLWWGLGITSIVLARLYSYKGNSDTLDANDYLNLTYLDIATTIISSCFLLLTRKLIMDIRKVEKLSVPE